MSLSRSTEPALWGDDEPAPLPVGIGGWTFTLRHDSLCDLRWKQQPVLRAIRFVARDRDWRTAQPVAIRTDPHLPGEHDFHVHLTYASRRPDEVAEIEVDLSVECRNDSELLVSASAVVCRDFLRNRLGLVVLHHIAEAGRPLRVHHPDGSVSQTRFPRDIAPHQPARNVRALTWNSENLRVSTVFAGDVFEMEDQRNWTDASFKTYSTPLAEPFPVQLAQGARITHTVGVTVEEPVVRERETAVAAAPANVSFHPTAEPVPQFLVGASTSHGATPPGLPSVDVLVEPVLDDANWRAVLMRAVKDAAGGRLDVRLVTSDPSLLEAALDPIQELPVARLGVYDLTTHVSEPPLWRALVAGAAARPLLAGVDLVAGARAHFTELNRTLDRLPDDATAVTFSITPQMHDTGRDQLLESLPLQRLTARQALGPGDRPLHVGPVTLRPRFNAVATSARATSTVPHVRDGYGAHFVPGSTDPRQESAGYAAWLVASAAQLALPGVLSVTFAEAWGPRGLYDQHGTPRPAAEAFARLIGLSGAELLAPKGDLPVNVSVLAARSRDRVTLMAANVGPRTELLALDSGHAFSLPACSWRAIELEE
ncbi:hypothetical protein [Streptomyces sp. NPDC004629]|uniref:hypothetical protein n=1 Tax=Streptomyces sp. NPDC004629 TaxID=3364705 RepID=UPI00367EEE3A